MPTNTNPWSSLFLTLTLALALAIAAPAAAVHAQAANATPGDARAQDTSATQSAVHGQELILNGFRAPSMGLEYRHGALSVHGGAYPTIINDDGERLLAGTTWFAKAGLTLWFLPVSIMGNQRSSFYAGASYLNDFDTQGFGHSAQLETGFRWVVYEGLFLRLGASALYSPGRSCSSDSCSTIKIRPNPGLGWAVTL